MDSLRFTGMTGMAAGIATTFVTTSAEAHVRWFAPYIVGAAPQPISATLGNPWFWIGIALVLLFFIATRLAEISAPG